MRKTILAGIAGATMAAVIRMEDLGTELHACDWSCYEEGLTRRSFRSPSHFLHHFRGLLSVQTPIAEVYLMRAIPPAFRESIMLVTAYANECSW